MRRFALVLAVVLAAGTTQAGDFGVQLQVELPLDPASVTAFAANPLGYAVGRSDLVSLSAFYEEGPWGVRFDYLSSQEVRVGMYRILDQYNLPMLGYQSDLGVYAGYGWNGQGFFIRLRGKYLLYGTTDAPAEQ